MWFQKDFWLGVLVLGGATLHRPLTFWAVNAWDLVAPQDVLATGLLQLGIGIGLLGITSSFADIRSVALSLLIGTTLFVIFNWHDIPVAPALWLIVVVVGVLALERLASATTLNGVAIAAVVVFLVAPVVQLIWAHVDQRRPYPILRSEAAASATATGNVEDVLVLVVDSYPMPAVAGAWFDHDSSRLGESAANRGFTTPSISWSGNTFTSLAIPSMMELRQVIDDTPKGSWGNRKSRYDITRGDSFAASSFRAAGFEYTHLESDWNGGVCGEVDRCLAGPWYDSAQSALLSPSIFRDTLNEVLGPPPVTASLEVMDQLSELDAFGDGELDYVFAHSTLPHPPYVVDSTCSIGDPTHQAQSPTIRIREQLECVDELLIDLMTAIPETTAVVIAGDHGSATSNPGASEALWTDSHIAERLGALLSYRIPPVCDGPLANTNVSAMRAITTCALDVEIPPQRGGLVIGEESPRQVSPTRIASIEEKLRSGTLERD